MKPKISVLMSVYNGENFLKESIDSILTQTFSDFEFIIVNDGSNDLTGEILASYKDFRLKIFSIKNRGLSAALNYGLEYCSTELVMRMDADDISYPHRFAALLEDWEIAGQPDVFGSGVDYINENGKKLWSVNMPLDDATIRTALCSYKGQMAIMHPTVLLRKSSVLSCGGYDSYFKIGQDNDLWIRMAANSRFGNSPQRLLKYRFQPSSDTAMAISRSVDDFRMIGCLMKLLSLHKKILIDAGEETLWNICRDQIISVLIKRIDISALKDEEAVSRGLTEVKILIYSRKFIAGILKFWTLYCQYSTIVLNRVFKHKVNGVSIDMLSLEELRRISSH